MKPYWPYLICIPCLPKSHPLSHGRDGSAIATVLCPASIPYHLPVPLLCPYDNAPVMKAVTSQSCLLPCCPQLAPRPRTRATSQHLQKSLQTIPQPHIAPQTMQITTWPLIGYPSKLTTRKGSCLH